MYMSQHEAEYHRQMIQEQIAPLVKRIEKLEASPQDEMENYRLALAWIKDQSTDPQAKEIAATALEVRP
jgi:hypothetical protein